MGLVLPTALLETRGAKSGALRRNAVIYFHDGDRVTIVASKQGDARHPAWFHNLRAHPDVTFGGVPMRANSSTCVVNRIMALLPASDPFGDPAPPSIG